MATLSTEQAKPLKKLSEGSCCVLPRVFHFRQILEFRDAHLGRGFRHAENDPEFFLNF
jgi:hypothetical protein